MTCPACQHEQAFTAWKSINARSTLNLKKKLLDRSLVTFLCGKCGHAAGVDQALLYHDMNRHVMLMLGQQEPGDPTLPEPLPAKIRAEYSYRLVDSVNELIEKVLILDADLDDRAVELFKVALMASIEESQRGNNPALFFNSTYANDNSEEQVEFVLVNAAGTRAVSVPLEKAYNGFVNEFCKELPTVVSECGQWLRVDREYALNYFQAHE